MEALIIVTIGIILIILMFYVLIRVVAIKLFQRFLGRRYDDDDTLHYFSCEDYKDINLTCREGFFFSDGLKLQYYIYENDKINKNEIIVLSHGLGAGHIQYMEEIAMFVKNGYQVFTYDVRGCNLSEGKNIGAFSNAIKDLNAALEKVESLEEFKQKDILLFGHSMGGYSVNNIFRYSHSNIIGVISVSSINKVETLFYDLINAVMGSNGNIFAKYMTKKENSINKELKNISSVESLKLAKCPVLLISGDKDPLVFYQTHHMVYEKELKDFKNVKCLTVKDKLHRPLLSVDSAKYSSFVDKKISEFNSQKSKFKTKEAKKKLYNSFDYKKMVEFDMKIINQILNFYKNCSKNKADENDLLKN